MNGDTRQCHLIMTPVKCQVFKSSLEKASQCKRAARSIECSLSASLFLSGLRAIRLVSTSPLFLFVFVFVFVFCDPRALFQLLFYFPKHSSVSTDVFAKFPDKEVGEASGGGEKYFPALADKFFRGKSEMFLYNLTIIFVQIEHFISKLTIMFVQI